MSDIYDIAASGMAAQRTQMDLIAQNLANAGVVRADGSIFRPQTAVIESAAPFESVLSEASLSFTWPGSFFDGSDVTIDDISFGNSTGAEPAGVSVASIVSLPREPQYRFEPGNPYAAKNGAHKGYVAIPDVDPIQQMIELVASGRAYDADVSMLQTAKQMDLEAADINRA